MRDLNVSPAPTQDSAESIDSRLISAQSPTGLALLGKRTSLQILLSSSTHPSVVGDDCGA
jgi:transcription elongation GreA/GreB family factor